MFITARPRFVSNAFESFVPYQKAEPMHQRLVEMTNNEVNAWNTFRPVALPSSDNWDQHIDDFGNENFPMHSMNSGYFQDTSSVIRSEVVPLPKDNVYTASYQNENQSHRRISASQQRHQEPVSGMHCFEKCSPIAGDPYFQWGIGHGRENVMAFSSAQGLEGSSPQVSEGEYGRYIPAASLGNHRPPYADEASLESWHGMGYGHSSYASSRATASQPPVSFDMPTNYGTSAKSGWWPETSRSSQDHYQDIYSLESNHDGLPGASSYADVWHTVTNSSGVWTSQGISQSTISPKLLTLGVSSAPVSPTESSQGTIADSSTGSVADDGSESSDMETLEVVERSTTTPSIRQKLPSTRPGSYKSVPRPPNNDLTSAKITKKQSPKVTGKHPGLENSSSSTSTTLAKERPSTNSQLQRRSLVKRIKPRPSSSLASQNWVESPQLAMASQATHHREAKDDFLVRSKLAGMSYKDIRRLGKFSEAESTLRGRFRTLTKHKTARVRKPEWNENDIQLLRKAVHRFAQGSDPSQRKIPWKQVAEYIANKGGSYHFGNATCRKRWDELQEQS